MNTRKILMLCAWLLAIGLTQAQTPQLISYQAVARDLTGKVLSEKPISVQVEILQGGNQGTAVYTETHELTTTKTGTINLLIGGGNPSAGTFAEIDWSKAPYFLRLGMKQGKEAEYTEVSNTQMVSVPYALYAEKAGSVVNQGETVSPVTPANYTFVEIDSGGNIYELLNGEVTDSDGIFLDFDIVYLNNTNLNITPELVGLPADARADPYNHMSPSSSAGRYIDWQYYLKDGSYNLKLVLKDKEAKVIAEYPFTLIVNSTTRKR
ncbi:Vir protein [Parabacteroides sp.]